MAEGVRSRDVLIGDLRVRPALEAYLRDRMGGFGRKLDVSDDSHGTESSPETESAAGLRE